MGWVEPSKPVGNDLRDLEIRNRIRKTINTFLEETEKFMIRPELYNK